jgi:predicted DNA-binding protein YlxM (UPF0122 family)
MENNNNQIVNVEDQSSKFKSDFMVLLDQKKSEHEKYLKEHNILTNNISQLKAQLTIFRLVPKYGVESPETSTLIGHFEMAITNAQVSERAVHEKLKKCEKELLLFIQRLKLLGRIDEAANEMQAKMKTNQEVRNLFAKYEHLFIELYSNHTVMKLHSNPLRQKFFIANEERQDQMNSCDDFNTEMKNKLFCFHVFNETISPCFTNHVVKQNDDNYLMIYHSLCVNQPRIGAKTESKIVSGRTYQINVKKINSRIFIIGDNIDDSYASMYIFFTAKQLDNLASFVQQKLKLNDEFNDQVDACLNNL